MPERNFKKLQGFKFNERGDGETDRKVWQFPVIKLHIFQSNFSQLFQIRVTNIVHSLGLLHLTRKIQEIRTRKQNFLKKGLFSKFHGEILPIFEPVLEISKSFFNLSGTLIVFNIFEPYTTLEFLGNCYFMIQNTNQFFIN